MGLVEYLFPDYEKLSPEQLREHRNRNRGLFAGGALGIASIASLEALASWLPADLAQQAERFASSAELYSGPLLLCVATIGYSITALSEQGKYETECSKAERIVRLNEERLQRGQPTLAEDMQRILREKRERHKAWRNREYITPWHHIKELYEPLLRRLLGREEQAVSDSDQSARPDA